MVVQSKLKKKPENDLLIKIMQNARKRFHLKKKIVRYCSKSENKMVRIDVE